MAGRMHKAAQPRHYLEKARETFAHANAIGLHHGIYIVFNFPARPPRRCARRRPGSRASPATRDRWRAGCRARRSSSCRGTPAWTRRTTNAEIYGTEIHNPDWWRREGDHYSLATSVLPSAAWRGREHELATFQQWNQVINATWSARYSPEVLAFRQRFYVG